MLYKILDSAINRHVSSASLAPVICCAFVQFRLISIARYVNFLNLPAFALEGQNKKCIVNMLLTCIPHCDAGPGCLIRTVCKYVMLILIMDVIFLIICFSSETSKLNFEN